MMDRLVVLRTVSKFFIPLLLLFALYVQWHGDFGPGGGFQAGVIFGAAYILYALIFGVEAARKVAPPAVRRIGLALGVLIYGGTGVASLLLGGNFLDYSVLAANPVTGQGIGILVVELGVGITVASAMVIVFYTFAAQRPPAGGSGR